MTDTAVIALIGIVPATVIAVATLITTIRSSRKADKQAAKLDEIDKHTNGTLSELTDQLKAANATIAGMHKTIERIAPTER